MPILPKVPEIDDDLHINGRSPEDRRFELQISLSTLNGTDCEIRVNGNSILQSGALDEDEMSSQGETRPTQRLPPILCGSGQGTSLFVPSGYTRNSLSPSRSKFHANCYVDSHDKGEMKSKFSPRRRSEASAKSAINSGADGLKKTLDTLTPLARDGFSLGSDLVARVMKGGSNDKQGRANDANLLARADQLVRDASAAFKGIEAKVSSLWATYKSPV